MMRARHSGITFESILADFGMTLDSETQLLRDVSPCSPMAPSPVRRTESESFINYGLESPSSPVATNPLRPVLSWHNEANEKNVEHKQEAQKALNQQRKRELSNSETSLEPFMCSFPRRSDPFSSHVYKRPRTPYRTDGSDAFNMLRDLIRLPANYDLFCMLRNRKGFRTIFYETMAGDVAVTTSCLSFCISTMIVLLYTHRHVLLAAEGQGGVPHGTQRVGNAALRNRQQSRDCQYEEQELLLQQAQQRE